MSSIEPSAVSVRRIRARVEGVVQGVGFRPHVYRLARTLGLGGFVLNDARGVLIEVEGDEAAVQHFLDRLAGEAPALAAIERVATETLAPTGERVFAILESDDSAAPAALVSPDTATCDACLAELFDPADRRFRYPFINCTSCGPRFTIVRGVPYDRPLTTMADFAMCAQCRAEYEDPAHRRFHAQPNACPVCGPSVRLVDAAGDVVAPGSARDPIEAAAAALRRGAIVAVKGIGGFHLACRADDEAVVAALRGRKHREEKPFALMVRDLEEARRLVSLDAEEERWLTSRARPIVLARRRPDAPAAASVAPGCRELGVMLPYSPLHHLLLADAATALVMTSGNVSDEPIVHRDDEVLERLGAIADLFLFHDRAIHTRTDDSVVRVVTVGGERRAMMLRRSRGFVPTPLALPVPAPKPLLTAGPELKSTFCLAKAGRAWVGHHIGDLENYETLRSFREGIEHFERLFAVAPEVVAHDLHPEYLSTKYAHERVTLEPIGVQHHHAHLAACLAEHGETGPALGVIYDGTGYGLDGAVWGGELLVGDLVALRRIGHLWPARLPGGAAAIREPWRMACAWLAEAHGAEPPLPPRLEGRVEPELWSAVARLVHAGVASPVTTSVGRLFDAVAALCGVRERVSYEGQAAIELERAADPDETGAYPLPLRTRAAPRGGGVSTVLDARDLVLAVEADLAAGTPTGAVAARFHNALVQATRLACVAASVRHDVTTVVLSGGVFQNVLLLERLALALERARLRVLIPERLPPNDGGIAFGQAAVAAASWPVRG